MNQDQIMSLVRSLAKMLGGYLIAHGMKKAGAFVNAEDSIGIIMTIIAFVCSHKTHSDSTSDKTPTGVASVFALLCGLSVLMGGCAGSTARLEQGGAYNPTALVLSTNDAGVVSQTVVVSQTADFALYAADASFDLAYSTVQTAFKIERDNRQLLWGISHEIKHALDKIRPEAWALAGRYVAARKAYVDNASGANLSVLQEVLERFSQLAVAAQAAVVPPKPPQK